MSESKADTGGAGRRTLWVGDLEPWVTDHYLYQMVQMAGFTPKSAAISVRGGRDGSAQSLNFGFVEFDTHENASAALNKLAGLPIPMYQNRQLRLKWAQNDTYSRDVKAPATSATATTGSAASTTNTPAAAPPMDTNAAAAATAAANAAAAASAASRPPMPPVRQEFAIFVGDLSTRVTDQILETHFKLVYPSVTAARVVNDATRLGGVKGVSNKCYGFVRFSNEIEFKQAIEENNGTWLLDKMMRLKPAMNRPAAPVGSSLPPSLTTPVLQQMQAQGAINYSDDPDGFMAMINAIAAQETQRRSAPSAAVPPNPWAAMYGMMPPPMPGMMMSAMPMPMPMPMAMAMPGMAGMPGLPGMPGAGGFPFPPPTGFPFPPPPPPTAVTTVTALPSATATTTPARPTAVSSTTPAINAATPATAATAPLPPPPFDPAMAAMMQYYQQLYGQHAAAFGMAPAPTPTIATAPTTAATASLATIPATSVAPQSSSPSTASTAPTSASSLSADHAGGASTPATSTSASTATANGDVAVRHGEKRSRDETATDSAKDADGSAVKKQRSEPASSAASY